MNSRERDVDGSSHHGISVFTDPSQLFRATGLTPFTALAQFVFACVAMGGFMFNQNLTVDEELGLFVASNLSSQGRFTLDLIQRVLLPPGILPLAPYLFLAAAYLVAYNVILYIHGLRHSWRSQLGFLIFILFPTNWLIQEWSGLAMALGVGLVCCSLAALFTLESIQSSRSTAARVGLSVLTVALLVLAVATFQSQVTLYLAIGVGVTLFSLPGSISHQASASLSRLGQWFLHAIAAIIVYLLTTKIYLWLSSQELQHVNIYFRNPYFMLRTEPLKYLTGNLEQLLRTYLTPGWFYGVPLSALALLVIGALVLYVSCAQRRSLSRLSLLRGWPCFAGFFLLFAIPLSMNIVSSPNRIPMRALFALPYVAWIISTVWLELARRLNGVKILGLGAILSCILIFQSLVGISHYYAARTLAQRSDQLVASTIASAMVAHPSQAQSITHLATQGGVVRENPYRTAWYSFAGSSFFNWDGGNPYRMAAWLRTMGFPLLQPASSDKSNQLDKDFASMKSWPQPGSIKIAGDTLLVKFGTSK